MNYPRVLVISNNCFSKSGSNGRTLGNFFVNWPNNKLAQFYIYNELPDFYVCNNYFRVTDSEALQAFIKGKKKWTIINSKKDIINNNDKTILNGKKRNRTPMTMLLREIIWNSYRWKGDEFNKWIECFNPEIVLIQAGDSAFMLNIALKIAKQRKIPLVIYNSESYYFKNFNYLEGNERMSIFYSIFHKYFKKVFNKVIEYSSHSIYICDELKEVYDKEFNKASTTIMTTSELDLNECDKNKRNDEFVISYLGNLGLGRHEALIEIADELQRNSKGLFLNVYGKVQDQNAEIELRNCNGIRYNGIIPYEDVVNVIQNSDVLVHAESSSEFCKKDLKYAFSTKIADSLASGTCFFLYAPNDMACTKYLIKNRCAYVATNKEELALKISDMLINKYERKSYEQKAKRLASINHNPKINELKFKELLFEVAKEQ